MCGPETAASKPAHRHHSNQVRLIRVISGGRSHGGSAFNMRKYLAHHLEVCNRVNPRRSLFKSKLKVR